jgi:hypothetical protein
VLLVVASIWVPIWLLTVALLVLLETAHSVSPIIAAWSHPGFRSSVMRCNRIKFIGLPVLIMAGAAGIGLFAPWPNDVHLVPYHLAIVAPPFDLAAFALLANGWFVFNVYHFVKQNYGVLGLYRRRASIGGNGRRRLDKIFCFSIMVPAMLMVYVSLLVRKYFPDDAGTFSFVYEYFFLIASVIIVGLYVTFELMLGSSRPRLGFIASVGLTPCLMAIAGPSIGGLLAFAVYSANHWLVAIGIASRVWMKHDGKTVIVATLAVGSIAFGLVLVAIFYQKAGVVPLRLAMVIISLRFGIGIVHFCYDRFIYQFRDARVMNTIGREVFAHA